LSAPTDSGLGIATATASPAAAYAVGQYFKGLAQENLLVGKTETAELTAAQETARAVAHGVIAAATAAAGDNNALTAAISAGGAEAAIPYVSEWLYGTRDAEKLSAEQKTVLGNIAQLAGTGVGLASGGSGAEAVSDGLRARNAVENNFSMQDLGISQNAQSGLQQIAHRQAQQFVVNANSSAAEKNKLIELLNAYNANKAISAEITVALGAGANVSVSINENGDLTVSIAGTAGAGISGFIGATTSDKPRKDGWYSEVCVTGKLGAAGGGCIGANLEKGAPIIHTLKLGAGLGVIPIEANANIGYQSTWKLKKPTNRGNK
ncbi:VENN motif pre-toxin domain-containing protein, partial [Neisseria dentiae]|uniref:VENN motif pre-toxin domain-containing protein n=1 Tax=Neisseria dentiae TaxID=194197 RepID=UPI00211C5BED